ncbi:MAG TPA: hypothetical protein VGG74_37645 [Kofleriaceae bacterium]|jgi:hypothetical protein
MAPRAFGALLGLVAALLLAASLAGALAPTLVPAWWDGHPRVGQKTFEHKAIHVGLLHAYGCNLGDKVECESLETGALLEPVGLAELAVVALTILTTIALLISIWKIGDRRKGLGRLVAIEAVLAAAIGGGWLALGPGITSNNITVDVPIGLGFFAFACGAGAALLAGLLARKVEREPLRLKTSRRMPAPEPLAPFNVRELAQAPRSSQPAIPPTPSFSAQPPFSPPPPTFAPQPVAPQHGPAGTGPHAPLMPPPVTGPHMPIGQHIPPAPPLFEHSPQLRPLYDIANVGVVPAPPPPKLPERAPTPVPRASLLDTSEYAKDSGPKSAPVPTAMPPARTKAASFAPPPRHVAPPSRPTAVPERAVSKQPTIAHAIPPMPAIVPARAETDPEPSTTVEIDAEAKAKWQAAQARKATKPTKPPPAPVPPPTPDTEENPVANEPDSTDPISIRPSTPSSELRAALADTHIAPAEEILRAIAEANGETGGLPTEVMNAVEPTDPPTGKTPPPSSSPAVTVDKADFDNTLDRSPPPPARPSQPSLSRALGPQPITVPKTIAPKPIPNVMAPSPLPQRPTPMPPPAEKKPEPKPEAKPDAKPHVPISTAPASLPPPKASQPAQTGPSPACPQCEAPMAWVEEHLRFYCKQCRMYF